MSNRKGTYFEIDRLANKVRKLEKEMKVIKEFMNNWGPDVQRKRDERDAVWDEMVRVVSIQKKHQQPKPGYDIHGNKWPTDKLNEENH
jgi:nitroimidazol reductase NimA-like FMN-containing flavoprotein (pyridoxamine 5'-phosphate oxidase superfamily)